MRHSIFTSLMAAGLALGSPAYAQDEGDVDDVLDDILGGPDETQPQSIAEERQSLLEEPKTETLATPGPSKKRVIQTLQRKNFMKIGRYEASPHLGFVTNDPFINRYLLGAAFAYHVTEIFAVEASGTFSPDLKEADYKPVTTQIEHLDLAPAWGHMNVALNRPAIAPRGEAKSNNEIFRLLAERLETIAETIEQA